jgi:hypothetical protein
MVSDNRHQGQVFGASTIGRVTFLLAAPLEDGPATSSALQRVPREKALADMLQQRAYPSGDIPADAYQKAWEHIQQMPAAQPPPIPTPPGPQSWLLDPREWVALLTDVVSVRAALAQSGQWTQIGPAPFATSGTGPAKNNAGIIAAIAVDPQSSQRVYVGTFDGGVWKTTDGGATWVPITDNQPTLTNMSIAVHPSNQNLILAGTGTFNDDLPSGAFRAAGTLRTTDGGTAWCQAGPTYGTDPLAVLGLVFDTSTSTTRVWAATSKGLWWSETAPDSTKTCSQVTWTRVTSLDRTPGVPDRVNNIFVSPWNRSPYNKQVLFASISNANPTNNGWYRSANRGGCWSQTNPPSGSGPGRSAIAQSTSGTVGTDVLYSLIGSVPTTCPSGSVARTRIYKAVSTDTGTTCLSTSTTWTSSTRPKRAPHGLTVATPRSSVTASITARQCPPAPPGTPVRVVRRRIATESSAGGPFKLTRQTLLSSPRAPSGCSGQRTGARQASRCLDEERFTTTTMH